jgi:hypothetical protein
MRKATKTVAMWFGITAGLAALEHGYFEILQGNVRPAGLMFPSWGADVCDPARAWHACEPAMSILPSFLLSGILTILLSLAVLAWSGWFIPRKQGGLVLILLAIALLLVGGGFFPPVIALVGGLAGMRINRPLNGKPGGLTRFAAKLWPWPLVIYLVWTVGQFPFGYFYNDLLKSIMGFGMLVILGSLPLSVYTGYANDATRGQRQGN